MIATYERARQSQPALKFAIMFQMQTFSRWQKKVKQIHCCGNSAPLTNIHKIVKAQN